jgi:hypothetical protein
MTNCNECKKITGGLCDECRMKQLTPNEEKIRECNKLEHCDKCGALDFFDGIDFWSKCLWNGDCYEWKGTVSAKGYGVISYKGRQWKAHRVAKILSGEFLPHWLVIDHLCKNTICVNPAHLRICTNEENVMAGDSFAPKNAQKTHCMRGHAYQKYGGITRARKGNGTVWRKCLICLRESKRKFRIKLKNKNAK